MAGAPNQTITITVDDVPTATATTDANGNYSYIFPSGLAQGGRQLRAVYAGQPNVYGASSSPYFTENINPGQQATTVSCAASPSPGTVGQPVTVSGTLQTV